MCDMKDGAAVWNVCSACDGVKSKHSAVARSDRKPRIQKAEKEEEEKERAGGG